MKTLTRRTFLQNVTTATVASLAMGLRGSEMDDEYQVGCYTRPWDVFDYRTALDGIAEAGYKYAGILTAKGKSWVMITPETEPSESTTIGEECRKRGLKVVSVYGDFSAKGTVPEAVAALNRLIEHCVACGSSNLMIGGTTEPTQFETYYNAVAESCGFARAKKVSISIKPHGGQNATGPQCRDIIARVKQENFGLWYDPGNIFYYSDGKLDPVDDSETVDGLVVGISIKDFQPPKEVLVTPGTGKVDFKKVLARLRKGGFKRGPVVVECVARGSQAQITAEARKARLFVQDILREAKSA